MIEISPYCVTFLNHNTNYALKKVPYLDKFHFI
jgi:hypothetical protein